MKIVESTISKLTIGDPVAHGALAAFPLLSASTGALEYLLLAEALKKDLVSVREVSEGGSVPELTVENRADVPVLVVDGEELVGAKQNRVANLSMLIPAAKTTTIPVSCVERGRWSYSRARRDFVDSDRLYHAEARAMSRRHVHADARRTGARRAHQGEVWREIDAKAARMRARSATGAMGSFYERYAAAMDKFVATIVAVPDQVGVVFAIGDQRLGLDVFDKPETLAAMLPKLVRSYGIDALDRGRYGGDEGRPPDSKAAVEELLDNIRGASYEDHEAVCMGRDVLITADQLAAGALVVDDAVVHLTAFATLVPARTAPDTGGDAGPAMAGFRQREAALHGRIR